MRKHVRKFAVLIFTIILLSGCQYPALVRFEQRIMVQLVGVDWSDDLYTVSVQFSMGKTSDGGKTENDLKTIVGKGANMYSAMNQARSSVGKEFFFSHNQVLFLGEGVLQNNAIQTIKEYLLYCDNHSTAQISGTRGKAEDILFMTFKDEYTEKNKVCLILENARITGQLPTYTIYEALMSAKNESESVFVPLIKTETEDEPQKSVSDSGSQDSQGLQESNEPDESGESGESGGGESSGGDSGGDSESSKPPKMLPDGGALIVGGEFATFLGDVQSEGMALMGGKVEVANIDFIIDGDVYSLELYGVKSKITHRLIDDEITFNVKLSAVADKSYNHVLLALSPKEQRAFAKSAEDALKAKIESIASDTVTFGGDVLSLEDNLKHRDYSLWVRLQPDWQRLIQNAKFAYDVNVRII